MSCLRLPVATALLLAPLAGTLAAQVHLDVTTRVSVDSAGVQANSFSLEERISTGGRYVVFTSYASDLVAGDTNSVNDVFWHDRVTGVTERASLDHAGGQITLYSRYPSVSTNGRFVLFASVDPNVVPGDKDTSLDGFLRDRQTNAVWRVTKCWDGSESSSHTYDLQMTPDARYIVFSSTAQDLVPGITNIVSDVFVHDRNLGTLERVSVSTTGAEANFATGWPSISEDGRFVTFSSKSTTLDWTDLNLRYDIYLHDRQTGVTEAISDGLAGQPGDGDSDFSTISGDGKFIAFLSSSSNLVPNDTNGVRDVFVYDVTAKTIERVSLDAYGNQSPVACYSQPMISRYGRFVLMRSLGNLGVPTDTNDQHDLFLRDRQTGSTRRMSLSSLAGQGSFPVDGSGSMSAFGESVAFNTFSPMTTDDTNLVGDVFVRELGLPTLLLDLTPVTSGLPATLTITGGAPSSVHFIAWNLAGQGELPSPWGIFDLAQPFFYFPLVSDPTGQVSLTIVPPPGLTGLPFWVQAIDTTYATLSNPAGHIIQ